MKKIYAINGSPRKNWNTATLLDKALEGARASNPDGVVTERIDLYDMNFTGCRSCFACKRIGGESYGKCAVRDDLHDVLEKLLASDGIIIGSPIYYRNITGELHSFYERLFFPYTVYSPHPSGIERKHIPTACIYTMNVTEAEFKRDRYDLYIGLWERFLAGFFGQPEVMYAFNTYQFDDYTKYVSDSFDEKDKSLYRDHRFGADCETAYKIGQNIIRMK